MDGMTGLTEPVSLRDLGTHGLKDLPLPKAPLPGRCPGATGRLPPL